MEWTICSARRTKRMRFRDRLARFFQNRNGQDQLGRFVLLVGMAFLLISIFTSALWNGILSGILWGIALICLIYSYWRMFSKRIYKRREENNRYLNKKTKIAGWFRSQKMRFLQRKEYKFFRCPGCRVTLRVPRRKGKVQITCRKCGYKFQGKT